MCGLPVNGIYNICSMCYGDLDYGGDTRYREMYKETLREREKEEKIMDKKISVESAEFIDCLVSCVMDGNIDDILELVGDFGKFISVLEDKANIAQEESITIKELKQQVEQTLDSW